MRIPVLPVLAAALLAAPLQAAANPTVVRRGAYLVQIMGCNDCHTPMKMGANGPEPDFSRALSGHAQDLKIEQGPDLGEGPWAWAGAATMTAFSGPWGISFAANITSDAETGIGRFTEADFIQAMRTGRHLGKGRPILPPMPIPSFSKATDADLKAVYAYLKSTKPIRNVVPDPLPPGSPALTMALPAAAGLPLLLLAASGRSLEPPPVLSATGLYAGPATGPVAPGLLAYVPQYPLWSDGARKARWAYLPPGQRIDARDPGAWKFPVGTRLWKEFAIDGRKVETRLIWRAAANRWVFASYHWREDQSEADLVPAAGLAGVADLGEGRRHSIPSRSDCLACHGNGSTPVLGFTALQLSPDRDPLALHREEPAEAMADLRTLVARRLLDPPRPEQLDPAPRIQAATPRGRAALGYLAANCGICHTPEHPIPGIGLLFTHTAGAAPEPALATGVDRPGHYQIPGLPPGTTRVIKPGRPGESSLVQRMRATYPAGRMPPLGTVVPDREAIALIEAWIAEDLPGGEP